MTPHHHRHFRIPAVLAWLLAAAIAGLALISGPASAQPSAPPVPEKIEVEDGHKPFLLAHAAGVQIYECSAATLKWRLVAPRAKLYDDNGQLLGSHFGGPTWQARDGSQVKAQRVDGVTVDPDAIQWLLLKATLPAAGPDGDRLAGTTYIQRIATTGGLEPPAAYCNPGTVGTVEEIPYTADYVFWKARGA
jgi:Protein of unknown function (DUF3455)